MEKKRPDGAETAGENNDLQTQGLTVVRLVDGRAIHVRFIRPDDAVRLQRFHEGLSRRSIYFRFFGALPHLPAAQARRFAEVNGVNRVALVAVDPENDEEIIGVVRFDRREEPTEAEMAIIVTDRYQGQGLGRALLALLVEAARDRGVRTLVGLVLVDNERMIGVLRHLGFPSTVTREDDTELIRLDITSAPTGLTSDPFLSREGER